MLAALGGAALCAWRSFYGMRDWWFLPLSAAAAALMLFMPLWVLVDILNEPPAELFGEEVRILTPGWPLFLTIGAAVSFVLVLAWQAGEAIARR